MAKFKPIHGELSGSIADNTYSRNSSGAYVRQKVSPVQPQTPRQTVVREFMTGLSKSWGTDLTPEQRAGWAQLAKSNPVRDVFGDNITLSGIALFIKCNAPLRTVDSSVIYDPPVNLVVRPIALAELAQINTASTSLTVTFDPALTATEAIYLKVAPNVAPGISFVTNLMKFGGSGWGDTLSTVEIDFPAEFPAPILGSNYHVRVMRLNAANGALSSGMVLVAPVVAAP